MDIGRLTELIQAAISAHDEINQVIDHGEALSLDQYKVNQFDYKISLHFKEEWSI